MEYSVALRKNDSLTADVRRLLLERPAGFDFEPGQSAEVAVNLPEWREECRPFSFTSLPEDEELELVVKIYESHAGVTQQLSTLEPGAPLIVTDAFGTIRYKGEGYFIAGGTGITPFLSILRSLRRGGRLGANKLLYSNRTAGDILLKTELDRMLGNNVVYNLTHEKRRGFHQGFIDAAYLKRHAPDTSRMFYVCGDEEMVRDIRDMLRYLGVESDHIVFEE
jgi:hypothetical protein